MNPNNKQSSSEGYNEVEDINYYSFMIEPDTHCKQTNPDLKQQNIKETVKQEPDIRFSIQSFLDDKIEPKPIEDSMMSCTNLYSILNEIQCSDDVKKAYSILEDDYIKKKLLPIISDNDFTKLQRQFTKTHFITLKSEIDRLNRVGATIAPVSDVSELIQRTYINNEAEMKMVQNNINKYENAVYKWRSIKGDSNCFYRTVMFYYLENIILTKNTNELKSLIYDIYLCFKEQIYSDKFQLYKLNKDRFQLILHLIYYALTLPDDKDSKSKAYTILIKVYNNYYDFDLSLILYLKFSLFKYIKQNEGLLYSKEFSVNINSLLPPLYQKDGQFFYQQFYERELMPLGRDAEKIVIYITPFVLRMNMKIYAFDINKSDSMLNEFFFDIKEEEKHTITLLFRNYHYELLYKKEYFLKHSDFFSLFSAIQEQATKITTNPLKRQINNYANNMIDKNIQPKSSRNYTSQIGQRIMTSPNIEVSQIGKLTIQNKPQLSLNKNAISSIQNVNKKSNQSLQKSNTLIEHHSSSNILSNKTSMLVQNIPSKSIIPNTHQIQINSFDKTNQMYNCTKCNAKTRLGSLCENCHTMFLKIWIKSSYSLFIQNNISNSIVSKSMETFENFLSKSIINYENGIKYSFNEAINLIPKENRFSMKEYINEIQSTLCIGCFHYLNITDNTFYFQIPCGCILCSDDCLKKFIMVAPFNTVGCYMCVCGKKYDLIELKYMINFLSTHHFKKQQKQMFSFIFEKIKNYCGGCNQEILLKKDSHLNIIEVNDVEIERILNINKFNHLICDRCWKDIKKENKFICNMCNSVHFITNKISKKEGKMNGNCLVF